MSEVLTLPDEMTEEIADVLGMPNFHCAPIAHAFRRSGVDIRERSEDEQAYVLFWALRLALKHGSEWRRVASEEMTEICLKAEKRMKGR